MKSAIIRRALRQTLAALPPLPETLLPEIRRMTEARPGHKIVVFDDDPTGTQTVHDVPVLTTWDESSLRAELAGTGAGFFILTNSRSLVANEARALNRELAQNLRRAAGDRPLTLISRSDSTLRGHFPLETDVLSEVFGPFDAILVVPFFEAGGRYTIGDVHYVANVDELVPAAETPFARDASFGYSKSNLREWIEEKSDGDIRAEDVGSISIAELRRGPGRVASRLSNLSRGAYCVINAAHPRDLEQLVVGVELARRSGKKFLFRTAAEFVSVRFGVEARPLLAAGELAIPAASGGGLIVVGSYVPKTTEQLARLLETEGLDRVEVLAEALLHEEPRNRELARAGREISAALGAGRDVVVFTSRQLITGPDAMASLGVGRAISTALVELLQGVTVRPRFLIAKGGITSSDLAKYGLGVKRAIVRGQILPGVPVWQLGDESRFPGLDYVVFPGNVGDADALAKVWRKLRQHENGVRETMAGTVQPQGLL